mgnify:CR=1 FL=1|tara:strand:- start:24 stop:677 length:654 start_codon:yes stop_codon:yes gene_type:complete
MKRSRQQFENETKVLSSEPKKIVLLGDGCIGKSTLFHKLNNLDDNYRFVKKYKATDNFDFNRINIKTNQGNVVVDLWDTAGQENRGGMLRDAYLKGADGVLLLYDVTESKTKENINKWLAQIKKISPNVPVAVLGNKSDKFRSLQQSESVKLRECNLQSTYGCNQVRNFLISIKENTHIEFTSSFWSGTNIEEKDNCLVGLEYVIGNLVSKDVKIIQ